MQARADQVQRCVELASAMAEKNQEDDESCTVSSSEESDELCEEMLEEEGEVELILVSRKVRLSIATVRNKNLSIILWYRPHRPTLKVELPSLASVTSQRKNSLEIKDTLNSL